MKAWNLDIRNQNFFFFFYHESMKLGYKKPKPYIKKNPRVFINVKPKQKTKKMKALKKETILL
jgi:hypothetical protein